MDLASPTYRSLPLQTVTNVVRYVNSIAGTRTSTPSPGEHTSVRFGLQASEDSVNLARPSSVFLHPSFHPPMSSRHIVPPVRTAPFFYLHPQSSLFHQSRDFSPTFRSPRRSSLSGLCLWFCFFGVTEYDSNTPRFSCVC